MARPIVLSNGRLHVGINKYGEVHDFYYPYVGLENHAAAKSLRHRIGVWTDGRISWLDDESWQFVHGYHEHSLVGFIKAHHHELNISLEFDDCVDYEQDVFVRNIHVINDVDRPREIRLFMHQVFDISDGAGNGDTVQFLPGSNAILTYRGRRAFVIGGQHASSMLPFDQHTVGLFGIEGHLGTYVDAEDGWLSNNHVEHGRVDSTIGFTLPIEAHSSERVHYWIAAGLNERAALDIHKNIVDTAGVFSRLTATARWWKDWLKPALVFAGQLEPGYQQSFVQSVLIIKAHIDERGGVIASTDTTMLKYSRDAYAYCWGRDSAYALWPLIRMGYSQEPKAFFEFCRNILHPSGYLMHKHQPDGALGSSWHPYMHDDGTVAPPIQEDETAIVLFIFSEYYQLHKDDQLLNEYYESLVRPIANFLSDYVDSSTGLPKPTYDLWEQIFATSTYTVAVVYAALIAAAELATAHHNDQDAVRWRTAAEDILAAARRQLYNPDRGVFYKNLRLSKGETTKSDVVDASSIYGVFMFGLFPFDGPELQNSVNTMLNSLKMPQPAVLGLARYEGDDYDRVSQDIPGNPWFVTGLWLAQYYLQTGQIEQAVEILQWCQLHMLSTGVLPEQINPYTDQYVSVAPLVWSQAEYVSTLLDLIGQTGPAAL